MSKQINCGTSRRDFSRELHRSTTRSDESIEIGINNERRSYRSSERSELHEVESSREFEAWSSEHRYEARERERHEA